ncbi:hypothetical protein [Sphingomonas sp.]|uniref:hypothetical protein n=1 Tax=Sphingomonas sp. TaxID=28214 RepID=UPI001EC659E0|nr:hypothetical protein [Sphingomonas sp.]MBX3593576.1 hypothetical protein [Sphingomonas sp.]
MSVLLAALLLAAQAAPSAADIADGKCVAAMSLLEDQVEEADKPGLQSTMLFFIGKIAGRSGDAAVGPAVKAGVEALKPDGAGGAAALAEPCADQVQAATKSM